MEGVSQHRKRVKGGDKVTDVCRFRLHIALFVGFKMKMTVVITVLIM